MKRKPTDGCELEYLLTRADYQGVNTGTIVDGTLALTTRSVLAGQHPDGTYQNVDLDARGHLSVAVPSTLYNEAITTTNTLVFSGQFLYDMVNSQKFDSTNVLYGTITAVDSVCSITASAAGPGNVGYAVLRSKPPLRYYPGSSNVVRFSARFGTPRALSQQRIGLGLAQNELAIGYNGTSFGTLYAHSGRIQQMSFLITTAITGAGNVRVILNSVTFTVPVVGSGGSLQHTAAQLAAYTSYTGWTSYAIDATVYFTALGVGAKSGTYNALDVGIVVTVATLRTGVALTESWTPIASSNVNPTLAQTIDPLKGNIYEISFAWLGFNTVTYSVVDEATGILEPIHQLTFANTSTAPYLQVPNMPFQAVTYSYGPGADVTLQTASIAAYTQIARLPVSFTPKFSTSTSETGVTTERVVLALRNSYSKNAVVNQTRIYIKSISLNTSSGTKPVTFKLISNPVLSITSTTVFPNWQSAATDALMHYDTTSQAYTGGTVDQTYILTKEESRFIEFVQGDEFMDRGDILAITATSTNATDVSVSVFWVADL